MAFVPLPCRLSSRRHVQIISRSMSSTVTENVNMHHETCLRLPSHPDVAIRSVMAPMVGASDYPFRRLLQKHHGVDLTFTQMIHAKKFCKEQGFRKSHLDLYESGGYFEPLLPCQVECLGDEYPIPPSPSQSDADGPCMVQLAGDDVEAVVESALRIMDLTNGRATGFDLNCGCPQGIAKRGNYGAFLMERNEDRVLEILSALRKALPESTAVSAKIRLPLDESKLEERIMRLVDTGITFLTVHGRTLEENKTKIGAVHKDKIRKAIEFAQKFRPGFPVVANGGMEDYEDVETLLRDTGAVAVMSSEALLETPNCFEQSSLQLTPRERLKQQFGFARDYLNICTTVVPPLPGVQGSSKGGSFTVIRGHLIKFLFRYLSEHEDLRDVLFGNSNIRTITEAHGFVDELESQYTVLSDDQLQECKSSSPQASWYRRHRNSLLQQQQVSPEALTLEERKALIRARLGQKVKSSFAS